MNVSDVDNFETFINFTEDTQKYLVKTNFAIYLVVEKNFDNDYYIVVVVNNDRQQHIAVVDGNLKVVAVFDIEINVEEMDTLGKRKIFNQYLTVAIESTV